MVGGSHGGRDNIRMQWHFNYLTIILMFCAVVNCLGSCLEIRIQSCKLGSIKVVLFENIQKSKFEKDFLVILLCNV
jgi:hypothetical protein